MKKHNRRGLAKHKAIPDMIGIRVADGSGQADCEGQESRQTASPGPDATCEAEGISANGQEAGEADAAPHKRLSPFGSCPPGFTTIGQVARKYAVSLRALRFYEDRGLLQPLRRGRRRFYDQAQETQLKMILKGKRLGFTLTEIGELLTDARKHPGSDIEAILKPGQILKQITELERQRTALDKAIGELRRSQERLTADDTGPSASVA